MVAIPKTPWSEIAASCHLEELLWRLVYIYGYKLFEGALLSDDCPFSRSPVRPDASTGSGQGVHGVSKDWVEVLKPSLDAVRLTVRAKPVEALPGHPPVRAESVEAFGLNQAPGSVVRSGAAPSLRRATY